MTLKVIKTNDKPINRLQQGDILSDVTYIEYVEEENGEITVSEIVFPLVMVLTQDCDLTWDYDSRNKEVHNNHDKYLFSVIVVPVYNYEHFIKGEHLSDLGQKMHQISSNVTKTDNKNLKNNENPRYHYLEFDNDVPIVNSVIDFKHYFTVNVEKLRIHKEGHFICSVSELFRERISQRFANYLSRIGLPDFNS